MPLTNFGGNPYGFEAPLEHTGLESAVMRVLNGTSKPKPKFHSPSPISSSANMVGDYRDPDDSFDPRPDGPPSGNTGSGRIDKMEPKLYNTETKKEITLDADTLKLLKGMFAGEFGEQGKELADILDKVIEEKTKSITFPKFKCSVCGCENIEVQVDGSIKDRVHLLCLDCGRKKMMFVEDIKRMMKK